MVIKNRNLAPGTQLKATYKKRTYTSEVVETEEGIFYRLDGKDHKSPSAAGRAVMGGIACNGWRFWSVEGDEPEGDGETPQARIRGRTKPRRKATANVIKAVPDETGVPAGMVKYHCSDCMAVFTTEAGPEPENCPEGHPRQAEDELAPL